MVHTSSASVVKYFTFHFSLTSILLLFAALNDFISLSTDNQLSELTVRMTLTAKNAPSLSSPHKLQSREISAPSPHCRVGVAGLAEVDEAQVEGGGGVGVGDGGGGGGRGKTALKRVL